MEEIDSLMSSNPDILYDSETGELGWKKARKDESTGLVHETTLVLRLTWDYPTNSAVSPGIEIAALSPSPHFMDSISEEEELRLSLECQVMQRGGRGGGGECTLLTFCCPPFK